MAPAERDLGGPGRPVHQVPVPGADVQVLPVDGHPVAGRADQLGGGGPDPERGPVVGVAVDAVLVVVDDGGGTLVVGQLGDPAGQLQRVGRGQRAGVLGRSPSRAARSRGGRAAPAGRRRAARRPAPARRCRRSGMVSPGRSGTREPPSSPAVAMTSTIRAPASASRRRVIPVKIASSSGCACRTRTVWPRRSRSGDHVRSQTCGAAEGGRTDGAGGQLRQQRQHPGQRRATCATLVRSVTDDIVPDRRTPGPGRVSEQLSTGAGSASGSTESGRRSPAIPGSTSDSRNSSRTTNTLQPNRWARPAHTPAMIRPSCGRVRVEATRGSFRRATDLVAPVHGAPRTGGVHSVNARIQPRGSPEAGLSTTGGSSPVLSWLSTGRGNVLPPDPGAP